MWGPEPLDLSNPNFVFEAKKVTDTDFRFAVESPQRIAARGRQNDKW
jgi:hypothetical protein